MRLTTSCLFSLLSLALACGDDAAEAGSSGALATAEEAEAAAVDAGLLEPLVCPKGSETGPVRVTFQCTEITVVTCKDLSNVVLELADGTRQRFEGLKGHVNKFSATEAQQGAQVIGVWVKAGNNKSGDGPGYGERVVAPVDTCAPPQAPCIVVDGACAPLAPPAPPVEDGCMVVDGPCLSGVPRPPSNPPTDDTTIGI